MILSKLRIYIDNSVKDKYYQSHFNYHVFFIGFYLSKQFQKLKIEADGINVIDIVIGGNMAPSVKTIDSRSIIHVPFDLKFYSSIDKHGKCIYYTQLVKEAFGLLANVRNIPYCVLIDLINTLQHDNFEYCWKFKTISLPLNNLKIEFFCNINTDDFTITIKVDNRNDKRNILRGIVVRTKPDDIFFSHISNKIRIERDKIFMVSKWGVDLIGINIDDLQHGRLNLQYCDTPYPDDKKASDNFFMLQRELKYDNYDFK